MHCILYIVQCTLYIVHCTMYNVQCKLFIVQYTVPDAYASLCTVYNAYCVPLNTTPHMIPTYDPHNVYPHAPTNIPLYRSVYHCDGLLYNIGVDMLTLQPIAGLLAVDMVKLVGRWLFC